jgi:hypothetical protein
MGRPEKEERCPGEDGKCSPNKLENCCPTHDAWCKMRCHLKSAFSKVHQYCSKCGWVHPEYYNWQGCLERGVTGANDADRDKFLPCPDRFQPAVGCFTGCDKKCFPDKKATKGRKK